ncbi:MFS transporter [Cohnella candidum]|nr:MFS transporter [Cohnella candidum]
MEKRKGWRTYENGLVLMMFIVFGLVFFERLNILYLFPYMAPDLGMNNTQIGLTVGVLGIAWAISTMVFSSLSDFIGSKKGMLVVFILIFSVATFLGGLVGSLGSLLLVRAFMGAAEGPVVPLIQSIVAAESTPRRRGFNMGLIQSASNLFGSALAPVIAIGLATAISWRSAFYVTAIPAFVMALVLMKFLRKPVIHPEAVGPEENSKPTRKEFFQLLKRRNIWLGMILSVGNIMFLLSIATYLPNLLIDEAKYSDGASSAALGLFGLLIFIGQAAAPAISDRIGRKPTLILFSFVAIFLPIAIILFYQNYAVLLVCLIVLALGNGYQPLVVAIIPAESVPRKFAASSIAILLLVAELIGGTLGPVLSGVLADNFGLSASMWIPIGAAIAVFLCSFGVRETAPVKVQHAVPPHPDVTV